MKCLEKIKEMAQAVEGDVENLAGVLHAYAPCGYWWNATGCSIIVLEAEHTGQAWYADACKELASLMKEGLTKCTPAESEQTAYATGESWYAVAGSPDTLEVG